MDIPDQWVPDISMSRTGMFFVACAGMMIFMALALITKETALLAGAAMAMGLTSLSFPKEMADTPDYTYSALPKKPWAFRLAGVVMIAAAIAIVVKSF